MVQRIPASHDRCRPSVGSGPQSGALTLRTVALSSGIDQFRGGLPELLGQRMNKGETLTDWRRRPLLPNQIRYAFDDVRYLLPVWKKLTEKLKRQKRTEWAAEEFAGAVRKARAPPCRPLI